VLRRKQNQWAHDFQKNLLEFRVNIRLRQQAREGKWILKMEMKMSNFTTLNWLLKRTCSPTEEKLPLVFP
jgi:hypothetical protein